MCGLLLSLLVFFPFASYRDSGSLVGTISDPGLGGFALWFCQGARINLLQGPGDNDPKAQAEFLSERVPQLTRLEWITKKLSNLPLPDAALITLHLDPFDASQLLVSAPGPIRPTISKKGINLEIVPKDQSIPIICDRARF